MTNDPYKVLGVPTTATDEEIKKAYRTLAKKYHPDANPGNKSAEQKMKEINVAYDMLINKKGTNTGNTYQRNDPFGGSSGFGGFGWQNSQYQTETTDMRAVRTYISSRNFQEALYVLNNISERTARWYYYSAIANAGVGNRIQAQQHAQRAVQMDPGNMEYQILLSQLQNPGQAYTREYRMPGMAAGRFCLGLCMCQMLAKLFGFC